LRLIK
jgi:cullin 3